MQFRVAFFPTNLATSTRFYAEQLGFAIIETWDDPGSQGVLLAAGDGIIELLGPPDPGVTLRTSGLSISIEVPDADDHWRELSRRNVPTLTDPVDQPWGHRNFAAADPDGVVLSFFQVQPHE